MKKILLTLVILLLIAGGAVFGLYKWYFSPVSQANTNENLEIVIPKGASVNKIANILHENNLVRHPLVFRIAVKLNNLDAKLQAGTFEISPALNPSQIAQKLTEGTQDAWITIIEGWRVEEIADYLATQNLSAFEKSEFLTMTASLEGKLYPDTYLVPKEITAEAIVNLLTRTHQQKVLEELSEEIAGSHLTEHEIITMASLLEREARGLDQMRRVAGILYNRLEIGMPLQVDATLQYAKGYDLAKDTWWTPPTAIDKSIASPYNTYKNPGLPQGPICSPGQEAVKAVLDPIASDDLFYLHAPDGSIHYGQTLDDHNANVNRYLR